MLNITTFLEKYISQDEKIIVACSTGADSMFLLYHLLESNYKKNIVACYFNHKTRPECEDEEEFLINLGKQRGFDVEVAECDFEKIQKLYPSKSFEELAREKRYQFLDAVCHIHNATYILTAHHLDDRIETFFFNLLRGTKLTGLINMTEKSGNILRPLLTTEKSKILEYLTNHKIQYFEDSSNKNTEHTRNKLRLNILPEFENIHPNHKGNISKLLTYFEEVKSHLDHEVEKFLYMQPFSLVKRKDSDMSLGLCEEHSFNIQEFQELSPLLQKEVIRYIYFISNNSSTIGLSEGNISEIIRFIGGKNNKTIKEIKGLKMEKNNLVIKYFTK